MQKIQIDRVPSERPEAAVNVLGEAMSRSVYREVRLGSAEMAALRDDVGRFAERTVRESAPDERFVVVRRSDSSVCRRRIDDADALLERDMDRSNGLRVVFRFIE